MKINALVSSIAVLGLVAGMPAVSMASNLGVSSSHRVEVEDQNDDHGGSLNAEGRFGLNGFGLKANLGNSLSVRLDKIIARYDANKDKYLNNYNRLKARLVKLEAKLSADGFDTTTLKADMVVLDTKIAQFDTDYKAYIDALRVAKTDADAGDDAAAKAQIAVAKNLLVTAKTSGLAVKTYYHNVIRLEIHNLKEQ